MSSDEEDSLAWARDAWRTLHYLCLHGTVNQKFLHAFKSTLHCDPCRPHFQKMLTDYPPPDTNPDLFLWSVDRHNQVNRRLQKPLVSYQEAHRLYAFEEYLLPEYIYNFLLRLIHCHLPGRRFLLNHLEWFSSELRYLQTIWEMDHFTSLPLASREEQETFLRSTQRHHNPEMNLIQAPQNTACGVGPE